MVRLVVKATLSGSTYPRRTSFPDAESLERQDLALKLARSFSLQPGSFRLAYRDDDNDLIELVSTSDLREALDYFSSDVPASSSASSSGWFGVGGSTSTALAKADSPDCITLKLELLVHYDGPSLSESGSSVYSLGASSRSRSGSSSAGSDDSRGWASLRVDDGPAPRARRALSAGSSTTDAESDRWILRTAYSDSRAQGARGAAGRREVRGDSNGEDDDDDDWDRRTVSSASQAHGAARPPPSRRRARHAEPFDAQRIPPALDSHGDALSPNFARGRFTPADPHPYPLYPDDPSAPSYPSLHTAYPPPPFYPHHVPPPPPPPHFSPGYPPPFFPPHPHAHLHAHPHAPYLPPPPPGFYPGDYPPPPASSFAALSLGSPGAWASPTASQRDQARDLFASSSEGRGSAGGSTSAREAARPEEDEVAEDEDRASSYTVTSSGDGRPEGDEDVSAREGEASRAPDGAFVCVVCGDKISGPRYTCAVCEAYDLCQECERLPDPPTSSASTAHDSSHILLKIPASSSATSSGSSSSASASSIKAAVSRAASLAAPSTRPSTSIAHELHAASHAAGDIADYWNWWTTWYGPHAHAHAHLRATYHPPPPPSSWYASAAGSAPGPAPPSTSASAAPVKNETTADREEPGAPLAAPPPPAVLALPPPPAPPLPPPASAVPPLAATPYPVPPAPPAPPPPPPMYPLAPRRPAVRALASYGLYEYANHGVSCRHCSRVIPGPSTMGVLPTADGKERGVRWLCANCPTSPSYNLCPDCEPLSQQIHDPTHAFLRVTHPLRRPLPSVKALLPLLYALATAPRAGPAAAAAALLRERPERDLMDLQSESSVTSVDSGGSGSSGGSTRTRLGMTGAGAGGSWAELADERAGAAAGEVIDHGRVMCDACGRRVRGIWMACCHCQSAYDLCAPCLLEGRAAQQAHNPAHIFVALKRTVNWDLHERLTRSQSRRPRALLEVDLYA